MNHVGISDHNQNRPQEEAEESLPGRPRYLSPHCLATERLFTHCLVSKGSPDDEAEPRRQAKAADSAKHRQDCLPLGVLASCLVSR